MKKTKVLRRILSAVCSICILLSGLSIPAFAAEIDGESTYGWTGVSLAKQPGIPFSMDFNKSYEGSLGVASENTVISDVVKITNSSGNVAYAAPLDYTLKGENDGIVKMTKIGAENTKNQNEIWIFKSDSAVTEDHSIEFDLYIDGDYSDIGFQERNVYSGWSNDSFKDYFKTGWQKVGMAVTDTEFKMFVDGALVLTKTRKFAADKDAFLRLWVEVTDSTKSATVAIDNLNIREGAYYTNAAVIDSTSESFDFNDNSTSVLLYNEGSVTSKVVNGANNFAAIDYTLKGNNDGVARVDFSYADTAAAELRGTVRLIDGMKSADYTLEFELYADSNTEYVGLLGNKIVDYDKPWLNVLDSHVNRNQWNDVAVSFSGANAYLYVNGTKVSEWAANPVTTDNGWLRLGVKFNANANATVRTSTIAIDNLKAYEGKYTGETYAVQAVIDSTSEDFGFNDNSTSVLLYNEANVTSKVVKNGNNFAQIDYTLKGNDDGVARVDFSYADTAEAELRGTIRLMDGMTSSDFTTEFELYADSGANVVGFLGNNIVAYDAPWLNALNSYVVRNQWNDVALSFSGNNAYLYVNGTKISETASNTTASGNGWLRLGVKFTGTQEGETRTATIAIDNLKAYEGAYTGEVIIPEFTSADGGLRVIPSYGGVVIDEEYTVKEVNDIISAAYADYTITVYNANGEVAANDKLAVYGDYVNFTKGNFTKNYSIANGKLSEVNFEDKTAGADNALLTDTHHVNDTDSGANFTKLNVNGVNTAATAGYESNVGGKEGISAYVELSGVPASSNATLNGNTRPMLDSMPRTSDHNLINIDKLNSSALTLDYTMQYKVYATGDIDGIDLLSRQYYQGDGTKKTYLDIVKLGFGENDTWVSRLTDDDIDNDYIGVSLEKNKWYDIALAFDLSECTFDLYIDGDYKATGSVGKSIYDNLNGIMSMALKPIFNEGAEEESRTGKFYWDDGQTYFGGYKTVKASSPVVDETAKSISLAAYADAAYQQDGTLVLACYNEGRLVAVKSGDVRTIKGDTTVSVNYEGDLASYDEVKLMFWESMTTLKPYISFDLK